MSTIMLAAFSLAHLQQLGMLAKEAKEGNSTSRLAWIRSHLGIVFRKNPSDSRDKPAPFGSVSLEGKEMLHTRGPGGPGGSWGSGGAWPRIRHRFPGT